MATEGLSLVGFMDRTRAIHHLSSACVAADASEEALAREWSVARAKLGPAFPGAGRPRISAPPARLIPHFQAVLAQRAYQPGGSFQGAFPALVEIAPILAVQFTIDLTRVGHYCGSLRDPSIDDMAPICLPLQPQTEPFQTLAGPQSLLLKTKSMNVKLASGGVFHNSIIGVAFGVSAPHVRVVRYDGRCYVQNGFHRAVGLALAGATRMPCLMRDINDPAEIGTAPEATFSLAELGSDNPPTLGHFIHGRAHNVALRALSRVLHVSWAEYTVPDE